VGLVSTGSLLLLLQFNNCAPVSGSPGMLPSGSIDGQVRLVDEFQSKAIKFAERNVVLHSEASQLDVEGLCTRDLAGAEVTAEFQADSGESVGAGQTRCHRGGFRLQLSALNDLPCGEALRLEAIAGVSEVNQARDQISVRKNCRALAKMQVPPFGAGADLCEIEKIQSPSGALNCQLSCYSHLRLISSDQVPMSQCSSL
jgi:hypothetical protein